MTVAHDNQQMATLEVRNTPVVLVWSLVAETFAAFLARHHDLCRELAAMDALELVPFVLPVRVDSMHVPQDLCQEEFLQRRNRDSNIIEPSKRLRSASLWDFQSAPAAVKLIQ
eukprot:CAMPEP_0181517624 /NCGR_PEP_ID=MMETSP1110-20121109/64811_1 /TAXON_ID=174948 /ORGANISM="Symbiodinium sp., Strain CCMP421" /LENGTH=112 /DNA_ID=CAMNT_0023647929 /DNA_START=117 /DNA_END=455 /DNA_ORIENTATION=+